MNSWILAIAVLCQGKPSAVSMTPWTEKYSLEVCQIELIECYKKKTYDVKSKGDFSDTLLADCVIERNKKK